MSKVPFQQTGGTKDAAAQTIARSPERDGWLARQYSTAHRSSL